MVFFVHGPRASALLVVTTTRTRNRFTPLVWWYCQDAPPKFWRRRKRLFKSFQGFRVEGSHLDEDALGQALVSFCAARLLEALCAWCQRNNKSIKMNATNETKSASKSTRDQTQPQPPLVRF